MGSRGAFRPEGGFNAPFEFECIGTIHGVKILRYRNGVYQKLPEYSNTSSAYVGIDKEGLVKSLRVFDARRPSFDVDFGHSHHHGLKEGEYHVHDFIDVPGKAHRERQHVSRPITKEELATWGAVINEILRRRNE